MKFIMSCLLVICSVLSIFTAVRASQSLANGKPTSQSSTYHTYDSSKAVDGCVSHNLDSNCCTHTDFLNTEAWWQVDLQQQSVIEIVGIIYRDHLLKRLAGFEIYLSNTPDWRSGVRCYQDNTASLTLVSANQNVSCQGVARYLTIYSDRRTHTYTWYSDWAFLELCEVYVTGCILGKYGDGHCNDDCLNCLASLCHPTSGVCDTCASGYYSLSNGCIQCPTQCAGNTCDGRTGACSDGCLPGYSGTYCKCPANCGNQACSLGHCSNCNSGYYGPACKPCPSGCNANTCDETSGFCLDGCLPGFSGIFCDCPSDCGDYTCSSGDCKNCNSGYYGPTCTPCPPGCNGNRCNKTSGICTNGCSFGLSGLFCNCPLNCGDHNCPSGNCTKCDIGFYGNICDQRCPNNCENSTCIKDSGHCEACEPGYHGDVCDEACSVRYACDTFSVQSTENQKETNLVTIIAVLATLLGISICCNIGFVVFNLRYSKKFKAPPKTSETDEIPSARSNDDSRNYEELEETNVDSAKNIYDTIQG